jgi:hypothetical protein
MKRLWDHFGRVSTQLFHKKQFRKWLISSLAVLLVLQVYFVRELLAAEILFAMLFVVVLVLCGIFYALGAVGERGLDLAEVGIRVVARSARWSFNTIEDFSKRQFRHRHSQSAP